MREKRKRKKAEEAEYNSRGEMPQKKKTNLQHLTTERIQGKKDRFLCGWSIEVDNPRGELQQMGRFKGRKKEHMGEARKKTWAGEIH